LTALAFIVTLALGKALIYSSTLKERADNEKLQAEATVAAATKRDQNSTNQLADVNARVKILEDQLNQLAPAKLNGDGIYVDEFAGKLDWQKLKARVSNSLISGPVME
jgi:uncharacterized protein HemX